MLYFEELKNILIISLACSVVVTSLVQKIKENLKTGKYIILISFITSIVVGTLFALSFSNIDFINAIWAGLFSFIGADLLYQTFEDKIFKSFSNINKVIEIPIENNIREKKDE